MAFTKLLLHCDGADASTTFTDSSTNNYTVTANGDAQIDTAQSKFGGASGLFDGTGDKLTLLDSDDWNIFNGDFTVDFWVRYNSVSASGFVGQDDGTSNNGWWCWRNGTSLYLYCREGAADKVVYNVAWAPSANTWYHLAYVRSGNTAYIFVDGVSQTLTTEVAFQAVSNFAQPLTIGSYAGGTYLNGWLDEVRISKGVARWTANFTPPTSAYTAFDQYTENFLESITTSDTGIKGIGLNLSDSMTSSDVRKLGFDRNYLDSISLTDLISMAKFYNKDFIDKMSLSDFMGKVSRLSQTYPDALTLQEIFNRVLVSSRSFIDTTVMSDLVYKDLVKSFREDVTLSDAILLLKKLTKLFEDSVNLTDSIQKGLTPSGISGFKDMITLTDILTRVATLSVSPKDTITLNEKEFSIIYTDRDVIEISANPQIQAGTHGQFLSLQYVMDYPKLRFTNGRGLSLFKGKDFTMNSGSIINFVYDTGGSVWIETSRMQDMYHIDGEG